MSQHIKTAETLFSTDFKGQKTFINCCLLQHNLNYPILKIYLRYTFKITFIYNTIFNMEVGLIINYFFLN